MDSQDGPELLPGCVNIRFYLTIYLSAVALSFSAISSNKTSIKCLLGKQHSDIHRGSHCIGVISEFQCACNHAAAWNKKNRSRAYSMCQIQMWPRTLCNSCAKCNYRPCFSIHIQLCSACRVFGLLVLVWLHLRMEPMEPAPVPKSTLCCLTCEESLKTSVFFFLNQQSGGKMISRSLLPLAVQRQFCECGLLSLLVSSCLL